MKRKLTLTVDDAVIRSAKAYARTRHASLSRVFEESMQRLVRAAEPPFSKQWEGCFEMEDRPGDARLEYLKERYR